MTVRLKTPCRQQESENATVRCKHEVNAWRDKSLFEDQRRRFGKTIAAEKSA
jgi:hypothetical protein